MNDPLNISGGDFSTELRRKLSQCWPRKTAFDISSDSANARKNILGQRWGGDGPRQLPGVTVLGMQRIGNYAVTFEFSDGHRTGIFSWDYLRAIAAHAK